MKSPVDETKDTVTLRAKHRDEEGKTVVERVELHTHNMDTLKHVERKLVDRGVHRMERHPVSGLRSVKQPPPKGGHGGKFTWEGPTPEVESEFAADPALDEGDPNYVDEAEAEAEAEEDEEERERIRGEVEVAKAVEDREGVARVDVGPKINV